MTISTVPVTGSYVPPDGSTIVGGQIVFALSGPDTEGDTVVSGETIAELDGANLPVGFELWRNTAGVRGTYYKARALVYVAHSTPSGTVQTQRSYNLGNVQVGDAVSYTLTELLNNPVPDEPGWNVNIDPTEWAALQDDFDAADTAATNASASATAAANSATAAGNSATAAAASAVAAAASADDASAAGAYAAAASASADAAAGSAADATSEAAAAAASAVAAAASEAAASDSASDAATDAGLALTRANAAGTSATAAASSAGAASGSATTAASSATAAATSATAAAASATAAAGSATAASAAQGYATAAAASADDAAAEAAAAQGYASDAAASALAAAASEGAANVDAAQAVSAANDAADSAADAEAAKVAAEAARDEIRELYVTLEDFDAVGDGVTPDNAAFAAAAAAGGDVWATQGKTYLITVPQEIRGASDFCLRMDGAAIKMGAGCRAVYRFYDYANVGIDFGATGQLIGNYDTDGAWASFATTPGITSGSRTGTASTAYIATTTTITINGLGVGYVKKGYRLSHINGGTTYSYIVTADAAITAGSATVTIDHGLEAPLTNGQLIYLNFWNNRWVVAANVGPTDTQITLEMANVTSADGNPRILAGTKFSFHDDYNNIDSIDYTKVCTVAIGGSVTGSYPTKTVTVTLTAPMGRSVSAGTMGTSIMDYYNNEQLPILFYGGTGGFVRGANVSNLRLHGFGQACIHAPWDGVAPSTKPNIDLKLEGNVDTSTHARGALCVAAWSTRGLSIKHNRGTYALGQLRSVVQVERSQGFKVKENSQYGGQYLCNTNGECSDGDISGNRGTHTMRMLRQGNTSTRLSFTRNIGIAHSSYTDWLMMVWSGMVDEDGAAAGNTALRLNSTTVGENEFSGATRTAGGYGSHIIIGPQNLDATLGETHWPRQVWVFGNRSTGATVHGIYGLNGDSVTYETNFVIGSGQAGIKLVGGDNSDLLSNEVLDCCTATPGKGIVLDGATNVKANGNKTTVDTGTGMTTGLSLINGATLRGEDNNDWNGTTTSGGLSIMAKQSRADLAALATYGWRAASGQIVRGGDLDYVGSTGATALPGLPGLLPYGEVRPEHGGTGADLASHQAAQNAAAITGAPILISQPATMSGTITEGTDYVFRKTDRPITWANSTDTSRALPGSGNIAAAMSASEVWHRKEAVDDTGTMLFASYTITSTSASAADYQRNAFMAVALTHDPSQGANYGEPGATINRGVVGVDGRGMIGASNPKGQAWGMNAYAELAYGGVADGHLVGLEVNVKHNTAPVASFTSPFQKNGIQVVPKDNALTSGVVIRAGGSDGVLKGYVVLNDAMGASATSAFELEDKWRIDKDGNLYLLKATGAESEEGIALMQADGLAVFTNNGAAGTTKFIRGDTLGAAGSLWSLDVLGYNASAAQKTFARLNGYAVDHTAGSEDGDLRISTITAGTVTEQVRIGNSQVLALPGSAAAPVFSALSDTNTGIWLPGSDVIGFAVGGVEWGRMAANVLQIGRAASITGLGVGGVTVHNTSANASFAAFRASADAGAPAIYLAKSRGTSVTDYAIVAANDSIGEISFRGADGTTTVQSASIRGIVEGTPAAGDVRSSLRFYTGSAANTVAEALRINASQQVLVVAASGLGYGTGAGGAVTQTTSRTTGVTLNKPTGAITLVSAAGSTAWQTFTLTNSIIAATDVVQVTQQSGTDVYEIHVSKTQAGSCNVTFRTTGGTTTEQPVFNFSVLKAVAS